MVDLVPQELDSFWGFVVERDLIWQRRQAGEPAPWTRDEIIASYHFTNVHRDRDPGTQAIFRTVEGLEPPDALFTIVAYRMLNRRQTFADHGLPVRDPAALESWLDELERARQRGEPLGSPRHQTSLPRLAHALRSLLERDLSPEVYGAPTVLDAAAALSSIKGVGTFYSAQISADACTAPSPRAAADPDSTCSLASGSRAALNVVTGKAPLESLAKLMDRSTYRRAIAKVALSRDERDALDEIHASQPSGLSKPLTYVDLEHSLCEWNRYRRLAAGYDLPRLTTHMKRVTS